mmetsp:Transcript_12164/g.30377  ORF Transcript_12164/g.30377 Transcript_12164/m.30377 type:complete len:262 (-) Transcript_12164:31-816(-)
MVHQVPVGVTQLRQATPQILHVLLNVALALHVQRVEVGYPVRPGDVLRPAVQESLHEQRVVDLHWDLFKDLRGLHRLGVQGDVFAGLILGEPLHEVLGEAVGLESESSVCSLQWVVHQQHRGALLLDGVDPPHRVQAGEGMEPHGHVVAGLHGVDVHQPQLEAHVTRHLCGLPLLVNLAPRSEIGRRERVGHLELLFAGRGVAEEASDDVGGVLLVMLDDLEKDQSINLHELQGGVLEGSHQTRVLHGWIAGSGGEPGRVV